MSDEIPNLDKLKRLCDELSNRDEQLKLNASALWDILEVTSEVRSRLSELTTKDSAAQEEIQECTLRLEEISGIINRRGCKKVAQHG
jgi:chromosome segregation ATPase